MFILRFFYVWHTLCRYGIDLLIPRHPLSWLVKPLVYLMPTAWFREVDRKDMGRIRYCLEALGPIYVKFGQALSTRPDLLPDELARELAKLQDNVKPFPVEQAQQLIEDALKQSVDTAFSRFDQTVLASASIAQVHTAQLKTGEEVVVKVLRPKIKQAIDCDIKIMAVFSQLACLLSSDARRLRLPEVVSEFRKTTQDELDLRQEAANGTMLAEHFKDSDLLTVPKIHWEFCHRNVLVMERVYGVPVNDMETLRAQGVDLKELANRGVSIFFTQVFNFQFFHADMHPGNIFVDTSNPKKPKYIAIDFGIMGSLSDEDQYYLAQNFMAFFERDYRRVAQLHLDSGWIPADVRVTEFEAAIRKASEPIFGKSLKDISFAEFLLTLFQTGRRFKMEVQPQLILLQKTFFNIEGLGRVLYPDLDLWETGKPFLKQWLHRAYSPKGFLRFMKKHHYENQQALKNIPLLINQLAAEKKASTPRQPHAMLAIVLSATLSTLLIALLLQPEWLQHKLFGLLLVGNSVALFGYLLSKN